MMLAEPTECREKGPAETRSVITTATDSDLPPVQTLIVHKSFSKSGCLLGGSNPYKEDDFSSQELISS